MPLLPAKIANTPTGIKVNQTLTSLRKRNADLREKADGSMTPAVATLSTQGGAAIAAIESAYLPEDRRTTAHAVSAAVLIGGGALTGHPEAVAAGNGILAILVHKLILDKLTARREASAAA